MTRRKTTLGDVAAVLGWAVAAWFGVIAATLLDRACADASGFSATAPQEHRAVRFSSPAGRPDPIAGLLADLARGG